MKQVATIAGIQVPPSASWLTRVNAGDIKVRKMVPKAVPLDRLIANDFCMVIDYSIRSMCYARIWVVIGCLLINFPILGQ